MFGNRLDTIFKVEAKLRVEMMVPLCMTKMTKYQEYLQRYYRTSAFDKFETKSEETPIMTGETAKTMDL